MQNRLQRHACQPAPGVPANVQLTPLFSSCGTSNVQPMAVKMEHQARCTAPWVRMHDALWVKTRRWSWTEEVENLKNWNTEVHTATPAPHVLSYLLVPYLCRRAMRALYIFVIATRILTSKHPRYLRIYFLTTNGTMSRNRIFTSPKCRKWTWTNKFRIHVSLKFQFSIGHVYTRRSSIKHWSRIKISKSKMKIGVYYPNICELR